MNDVASMKMQVEQLRLEVRIKREKTSKTIEDMKKYVVERQGNDHLLNGFKKKDYNPFKSKEVCELI
ncbi:unnamed protein product [Brachionus calyciflorus]|uniref:G protein gamma domain-containing protein n=1 Tax=Brachionus calyciflorus TaxID=104777 RepID=A0A813N2P9_9BILA|nr:unnamed protein product [Brachionus calyciflorus]